MLMTDGVKHLKDDLNYLNMKVINIDGESQLGGCYACIVNVGAEDISNLIKEKLPFDQRELLKKEILYPISICQNRDLSFDIILGVLKHE